MRGDATCHVDQGASSSEGFIVVAALWILAALAMLAAIYSVYVVHTAMAMSLNGERVQGEALVTASLDLAVLKLTPTRSGRPSLGRFSFQLGGANVAVDFRSEAGRIDLNAAPKELLAGLFTATGANFDAATNYAARIIAWRTKPGPNTAADETSNYRVAGLPHGPRLAPFPHPAELSLVLNLPPAVVEQVLPLVTTYSGQAQVNVLAATPEVLAALPGMAPERLQSVLVQQSTLAQREIAPQDAENMLLALGPARNFVSIAGTKTNRVNVRVTLENGRRMNAEVVILVPDTGNDPYAVLSWRDDFDEPGARSGTR